MRAATELRKQIESALGERIPSALSVRPPAPAELLSCGLPEVDAVLGGGLPVGAITELTGAYSSGRTTLALATLAQATRQGEGCAYVDVSDALDPLSASDQGVQLRHLLWIRTREQAAEVAVAGAGSPFPAPVAPSPSAEERPIGRGWCHPRNETIGLHHAIGELFQPENTAPAEVMDFTPRCSESVRRPRVQPVMFAPPATAPRLMPAFGANLKRGGPAEKTPWTRLDHALRATDLLLSTGGFRVLVLDMADVSPEQARRVPLATWYRYRLQAKKSRTLFLLMTRVACANSCAAISLCFKQSRTQWTQTAVHGPALLAGLRYGVSVERSRAVDLFRKRPAASAEASWSSATTWLG
jgi:hypothetical protein